MIKHAQNITIGNLLWAGETHVSKIAFFLKLLVSHFNNLEFMDAVYSGILCIKLRIQNKILSFSFRFSNRRKQNYIDFFSRNSSF